MKIIKIDRQYSRRTIRVRIPSYSERETLAAYSEYSPLKAFRDYVLCIIAMLIFGFVADITEYSNGNIFKLATILGVFLGMIPPLLLYASDLFVKFRNRKRTLKMIEELKVREFGGNIYVIKYPKTGVYELTDTHVFVWVTPEQLVGIESLEDAIGILNEYKSK